MAVWRGSSSRRFTIENAFLALPLAALTHAFRLPKRLPRGSLPTILLVLTGTMFWLGGISRPMGGYGARSYPQLYQLAQLATLVLLAITGYRLGISRKRFLPNGALLPILWLSFLLVTYLSYNQLHIHYLYECLPPIILLAGWSLDVLLPKPTHRFDRRHRASVILMLAACALSFAGMYHYFDPAYGWRQSTVREVSRQLKQLASPGEEVFTAGTIFALEAGLRPCLRITHPYDYLSSPAPYGQLTNSPLPDIPRLIERLATGEIRLVIADQLTYGLISTYPELRQHVMSNYVPLVDIDNVKIGIRSKAIGK